MATTRGDASMIADWIMDGSVAVRCRKTAHRDTVRVATFSTLLVKQTRKQICNRDYWTRDQVSTYWRSIFDMLFDGGDRKPSDQTSPPLKTHS